MPWSRTTLLGIFGLIGLAALVLVVFLARGEMALGTLAALLLLGGAVALAATRVRRPGPPRRNAFRPDLDRLRPGRLRDGCLHVVGYHLQLEALAETLPHAALRAALRADLPTADAAVRAVYDLCLGLQAYELGESQPLGLPPAGAHGADPLTLEAESALQDMLDTFSHLYATLRQSWSEPAPPALSGPPLTALEPHTLRLRELAAAFAPRQSMRSVARGEP